MTDRSIATCPIYHKWITSSVFYDSLNFLREFGLNFPSLSGRGRGGDEFGQRIFPLLTSPRRGGIITSTGKFE